MTTDGACTAFQLRPFWKNSLEDVCQVFEVAVFTAGSKVRIQAPQQSFSVHSLLHRKVQGVACQCSSLLWHINCCSLKWQKHALLVLT